ncbi:MAG: glycosyltransferase family 4 protein [Chitinophagaceae bacterium]|nr:glycosyltransferase family 4 protein [Chitinophagaceae bacterium]
MGAKSKIRILEGIRQGKVGGGESVLLNLVEHLNKDEFEPVVLSFTGGMMVEYLEQAGIPVHVIHSETPFDFRIRKKVKQLMIDEKIDLVHAHGTRAASNMFWAAKKNKLPLIYTCHGWSFHPDQHKIIRKLRIRSEKFLTEKADINICVSQSNADEGKRLFKNYQPLVILNAVDTQKFDCNITGEGIRKDLRIKPEELLVSFIARFTWQKQPLALIRAFENVVKEVPNIRLVMVGDGEEKEKAIRLIRERLLGEKIILLPFRRDVPELLAASDIFVLPSLWEGLPMGLLEAMAMKKAIIASRVDGTAEVITDGENGILINPANMEDELARSIIRLAKDESLRKTIAENALGSIRNRYNVQMMTRQNEAVYRKLIANMSL